jgi:type IV secretion system protein VirB4
MLNLAEYRHKADRLADHLPWAALVAPGIVLNKDGSFQRSFRYRGPDLESATEAELVGAAARVNNVLRRFGSGWALFFEAARVEALGYPQSDFPDPVSALVDLERQASFEGGRDHFESHYHLTLAWLPPPDSSDRAARKLIEGEETRERDWRQALERFRSETDRAFDLLGGVLAEIAPLDDRETLSYLHSCISSKAHSLAVPETPIHLDALLVDEPLVGGLRPVLGDRHLRTLTILGFPNVSRPGILDALNHLGLDYRWTTRFIALDKTEASRALTRIRRQWFNKRKSVTALLREVIYNQPAPLLDSNADSQVGDSDLALQALGSDEVAFGYLTTTVTLADTDPSRADEKARQVERVVNSLGFTTIRESVNAVEAWLSSLPGHAYANVRQPLVHTLNLAHLMPLSAVWAGPERNAFLDGPPLVYAETSGSTPFRLSTHVGDVGHMLIVGPTGAGKSVLLALMALQFRRYGKAQVFLFDKGLSARAAVLACGGRHLRLVPSGSELAFQPLRGIDDPEQCSWALDWLLGLLAGQDVAATPEVKDLLWSALRNLANAPEPERTMTGLSLLIQSNALRAALRPYTLEGPLGGLLDAAEDSLELAQVQCFETEELMASGQAVRPVLTYLFRRLEERFTGAPTLLILDEAWIFLDHPLFAARIREWLKVLRKKNVAVVFATQSLADIAESSIAPAIVESCPQRIFLANDRALEPLQRSAYERFGLNARQAELIARATPKRHYYLQGPRGNRLFELGLGPIALALCGASDPACQKRIDAILDEHGEAGFARRFLEGAGLDWAAELLPAPTPSTPEEGALKR